MFELVDVSRLDAAAALDLVEAAERARRLADVQRALAMLRMVQLYRHEIATAKVQLGAQGTPLVDDFACLELAAALHRDQLGVTVEVAELLTLHARHPHVWAQVIDCQVPLWLARKIARTAWDLPVATARWLDATIAPFTTRLGTARLLAFTDALVVQADPVTANQRLEQARRGRRVTIDPSREGVTHLWALVDPADAIYLNAALTQLSTILASHGDHDSADARRATALGILATPARALALLQQAAQPALTDNPAELAPTALRHADPRSTGPGAGSSDDPHAEDPEEPYTTVSARSPQHCAGHTCGTITVHPDRLLPKATLIVHISADTLDTGHGLARAEQIGPLTLEHLQVLLHNKRITIQPVLDTAGIAPVDCYEIPARTRRAVLLRQPWEVFPYSSRPGRRLDLDHTVPYRWDATPGQTAVGNLGPLTRKAHRAKTHTAWQLTQPVPGTYRWTTPLGRHYLIAPDGLTQRLAPTGTAPTEELDNSWLLPDLPAPGRRRQRPSRPPTEPARHRRPILRALRR